MNPRPTTHWLSNCIATLVATLGAAVLFSISTVSADNRLPIASMYSDARPFLDALAREGRQASSHLRISGISVPHHLLAADLIARGFQAASGNQYDRIILVSPDHFSRSRRPMATTRRDIETVFGLVRNDQEASGELLQVSDLFDDSDLFAREHGIAALLPFVRHYFPNARIVPIAISYNATREQCDRAVAMLGKLTGPRTLVVQSTDYSHYLPADVARQRDQETLNVIAANDFDAIFRLVQPDHMDFAGVAIRADAIAKPRLPQLRCRYRQPKFG